ncbi:hypothetical protein [Dickeya sp. CFBP 2040]|uniref:hypothetical protein n=1 Tax=Dickeya sp. CFBP 2040 TaxID=2718531 RepID=UPI001444A734|nr:hypothetical protein [Dickeya sp. CFBP 2040]
MDDKTNEFLFLIIFAESYDSGLTLCFYFFIFDISIGADRSFRGSRGFLFLIH